MTVTLVCHLRNWSTIMVNTTRQECLVYRRGNQIAAAERIALRVSGKDHEWTETGREDFAGMDAPAAVHVEITTGTTRRRQTSIYAYHRPQPNVPHRTPAPKPL
jgi:hypothetical protein